MIQVFSDDARVLGLLVLHDQRFLGLSDVVVELSKQGIKHIPAGDRFGHERQRAVDKGLFAGIVGGDYAYRDVARGQVIFEAFQDAPAADIRQEDIQSDGMRIELAGQRQRGCSQRGGQSFEAAFAGRVEQEASKRQVVFHNEEHTIAGLDVFERRFRNSRLDDRHLDGLSRLEHGESARDHRATLDARHGAARIVHGEPDRARSEPLQSGDPGDEYKLPTAKKEGISIQAYNNSPSRISLVLNRGLQNKEKYGKVFVIAQINGVPVFKANFNIDEGELGGAIPKRNLPPGILQITVFDTSGVPLSERLVFVDNHHLINPGLTVKSLKTSKKESGA